MKKTLLVFLALGFGFSATADEFKEGRLKRDLTSMAYSVADLIDRNEFRMDSYEKREVRRLLVEIRRTVRGGNNRPTPPRRDSAYFCVAGCIKSNGDIDRRYLGSAQADFEAQAQQLARENLRKSYNCSYGVKVQRCDRVDYQDHFSSVACTKSTGRADTRYQGGGKGNSQLESEFMAYLDLKKSYNCSYGNVLVNTDSGSRGAYCVAACTKSSGNPDTRYTAGATGDNRAEAEFNAYKELKKKYNCSYGIVTSNCSDR